MKNRFWNLLFPLLLLPVFSFAQADSTAFQLPEIRIRSFELTGRDGELLFSAADAEGLAKIRINRKPVDLLFRGGQASWPVKTDDYGTLLLINTFNDYHLYHVSSNDGAMRVRHLPLWLSILPPLIAILLALIFREVIVSLFVGVWVGAFIAGGVRIDSLYYLILSFLQVVEKYVITALNDAGHLAVLVFSLLCNKFMPQ